MHTADFSALLDSFEMAGRLMLRSSSRAAVLEWVTTPCVVTKPWSDISSGTNQSAGAQRKPSHVRTALINPANTALSGTALPYFPRGGPVPAPPPDAALQSSTRGWGGMEAGDGLLYPAQAVDGVVHALGGAELRRRLNELPSHKIMAPPAGGDSKHRTLVEEVRCAEGNAVVVTTAGCCELERMFDMICHTVPPFWPRNQRNSTPDTCSDTSTDTSTWQRTMRSCYISSVNALVGATAVSGLDSRADTPGLWIATPLLGAGARGAPVAAAAEAAVEGALRALGPMAAGTVDTSHVSARGLLLRFVLPELSASEVFGEAVKLAATHHKELFDCYGVELVMR